MGLIDDLIEGFAPGWKSRRADAAVKRAEVEATYQSFLQETRPLAPTAEKHPEAALYRHAWKRALVLEILYDKHLKDAAKLEYFKNIQECARRDYFRVAPENLYGTVPLKISRKACSSMLKEELARLSPALIRPSRRDVTLACIYLGVDSDTKQPYIGKTSGEPEFRWMEHRKCGTGPFKSRANYAEWRVLELNLPLADLDRWEAYYIGLFNACEAGHNDTRGNDATAYQQGVKKRLNRGK